MFEIDFVDTRGGRTYLPPFAIMPDIVIVVIVATAEVTPLS